MKVFYDYARHYDLFYADKDYVGEADYIHELLMSFNPQVKTVLDLGCGTGGHALEMARRGYTLHGVDRSEEMLRSARAKLSALPPEERERLSFSRADIRWLRLEKSFDAVLALFHVMSYQVTDEDFQDALLTAKIHLTEKGIFIFDCWYGPAVRKDPPIERRKRYASGELLVSRSAQPFPDHGNNTVEVRYHVVTEDQTGRVIGECREMHRMRYFFDHEVNRWAELAGMRVIASFAWPTRLPPAPDNWSACFVVGI